MKTFCEKNGLKWPLCEEVVYLMAGAQEQHTYMFLNSGCGLYWRLFEAVLW